MKKHLIFIGSAVVAAIAILLILNFTTDKPNTDKNGFTRSIMQNAITKDIEIEVPRNVTKIANVSGDTVYLQTRTPGLLYYTYDFKKLDTIKIQLPDIPELRENFSTEVHYPQVYILGGNAKCIVSANIISSSIKVYPIKTPGSFLGSAFIDEHNIVVRCINAKSLNAEFYKVNYITGSLFKENNISKPLKDAGFTHSGELQYDKTTHLLLNPEFYCNNINIIDTSLNLVSRYHSIDTISTSTIKLRSSTSGITNSNPRKHTNGTSSASNGYLYTRSYLKADNELSFENMIIIDRYNISKQQYTGSFYLPYLKDERMRNIIVDQQKMFALFQRKLARMVLMRNQ